MSDKARTLLGIGEDLVALENLLEEVGGEVSEEEAEAAIDSWLQENMDNLKQKLDGYANLMEYHEGLAQSRRAEAARRMELAKSSEGLVSRMKKRLLFFFTETEAANSPAIPRGKSGLPQVQTTNHTVSVANNGGQVPVEITGPHSHEWAIANGYADLVRVTYSWDTDRIRQALENKEPVPFARLGDRGKHIRIR